MEIARLTAPGPVSQPITVSGTLVSVFLAFIAVVPPVVSNAIDAVFKRGQQEIQVRDENLKAAQQTIDEETKRRQEEAEWIRAALRLKDVSARGAALTFYLKIGVIRDSDGTVSRAIRDPQAQIPESCRQM